VAVEETAYRLAAQVNALPFRQHLTQVAEVEAGLLPAGQNDGTIPGLCPYPGPLDSKE